MKKNRFGQSSFNEVVKTALSDVKNDTQFINELKQRANESRNPSNVITKSYNDIFEEHKRKGWIVS